MHLESLLREPVDSPKLLLCEATYGDAGRARLLQEVMALANADARTPARYILFGVARGDDGALTFAKLGNAAMREVEKYAETIRQYIEPTLKVSPVAGQVNGNIVAALELSDCVNPPYVIKTDVSTELRRGDCWVYEGGLFRPAQRADLDRMYRHAGTQAASNEDGNVVKLGFGGDPAKSRLRIALPDVSSPPSKLAASRMQQQIRAKQDAAAQDLADTRVQRLIHARLYGNESEFEEHGVDTLVEGYNAVLERHEDQDNFYFFETNAVHLNLAMVNTGHEALENISLLLTFPYAEQFRVADKLYPPPGKKRTAQESELLGYPRVKIYDRAAQVKCTVDYLEPDRVVDVFEQELRIAVQAGLAGKKVRAKYSLQADGLETPEQGSLTMVFA